MTEALSPVVVVEMKGSTKRPMLPRRHQLTHLGARDRGAGEGDAADDRLGLERVGPGADRRAGGGRGPGGGGRRTGGGAGGVGASVT